MDMDCYAFELKVYHRSGVLAKVASQFSRRGCNIQSLDVRAEEDGHFARMHITVKDRPELVRQIYLQMDKLEDVISVTVSPDVSCIA